MTNPIWAAVNPYWAWVKIAGYVLILGTIVLVLRMAYGFAYDNGHNAASVKAEKVIAQMARAEADAQAKARATERGLLLLISDIAAKYEQDKTDAQANADRLAADLRAGNERLHTRWRSSVATCDVSSAAASAGRADDAAREQQDSAGRIIGAADRDAAKIRALQAVTKADRK